MKNNHGYTDQYTLDIDPENLSSCPCVEQVVHGCTYDWHEDETDPKQGISIQTLVIFHSLTESCLVFCRSEEAAVLESEQIETGQHHPYHYSFLCSWVLMLVGCIETVMAFVNSDLVEFVKDTVEHVVCY